MGAIETFDCRARGTDRILQVGSSMAASTMSSEPKSSQVAILHKISSIVSSERSVDEMLGEIVGLTVQATDCDACLVYLIDQETNEIVLRASQVPHAGELGHLSMQMGEGVTGWVVEHKSVVALSSNAAADYRFKRFDPLVEDTYEADRKSTRLNSRHLG